MVDRSLVVKTVRTFVFLLLAAIGSPLAGQDAAAYVSRLTAQPASGSVVLTRKDAEGYPGAKYEVWRSDKEIVKDGFSQAKLLATINAGVEAFEDTTVTSPSFYLVLLKDRSGNRKNFYIPYRNKTTAAVKPETTPPAATAQVKVGVVAYANPQIAIPFQALPADRKLLVFRRASPMTTLADLRDATLLGNTTGASGVYRDTPPPGLEFYYAIVDAQAYADTRADAFYLDNTTDRSAGFPLVALPSDVQNSDIDTALRPELGSPARSLPLPRLQVGSEPDSGAPLAPPAYDPVPAQPLSEATQATLRKLAKAATGGSGLPSPEVLPEERSATQEGAAKYLVQIQKAYLEPKDWKGAIGALETVLRLTLDSRTAARARFYLGESLAYLKDYRRAFVELLSARESYPVETRPFLEALFSLLASTPD